MGRTMNMIRERNVDKLAENIKGMCIETNHFLSRDMDERLKPEAIRKMEIYFNCSN